VRQGLTPIPDECKGTLYVATNKPIPVGIEGTDIYTMKDVGAYYLIHRDDLKALVIGYNKSTEMKKEDD